MSLLIGSVQTCLKFSFKYKLYIHLYLRGIVSLLVVHGYRYIFVISGVEVRKSHSFLQTSGTDRDTGEVPAGKVS